MHSDSLITHNMEIKSAVTGQMERGKAYINSWSAERPNVFLTRLHALPFSEMEINFRLNTPYFPFELGESNASFGLRVCFLQQVDCA